MASDEFEDLAKFLTFLRKDPINSHFPEEISKETNLPLETAKAIAENAILNLWVDVETRVTNGNPLIKINYAGNRKLNQLTGKAESSPSQSKATNITVTGGNVNIGKDNKINSDNTYSTSRSQNGNINWTKWGAIFGGFAVLLVAISILVILSLGSDSNADSPTFENTGSGDMIISGNMFNNQAFLMNDPNIINIPNCQTGEIGMTFQNCELGFKVTRPDTTWQFIKKVLDDAKNQGVDLILNDSHLGALTVGSNTRASYTVVVSDKDDPEKQNLKLYAENLEKSFAQDFQKVGVYTPIVSVDDDSVKFRAIVFDDNRQFLYEELLEKHNHKFYKQMIGIWSDIDNVEQYGSELTEIVKSFEYIE